MWEAAVSAAKLEDRLRRSFPRPRAKRKPGQQHGFQGLGRAEEQAEMGRLSFFRLAMYHHKLGTNFQGGMWEDNDKDDEGGRKCRL